MNAPATPFCPKCRGAVLAPGARSLGVPVCKCRHDSAPRRRRRDEEWDESDEFASRRWQAERAGTVVHRDVELRAVDRLHAAALKKGEG